MDSKTQASLSVCIICAAVGFTEVPRYFKEVGQGGIQVKLIRRDVVLRNAGHYLPDGKLIVLCTLHYLEPGTYDADQVKEPVPVVPPSELASCMNNVFTKGDFIDITVFAGEREFPAHRAILAERSDVFRTMFDTDMIESRTNSVSIEDMSADAVEDHLTFIYTDSATNISENAMVLGYYSCVGWRNTWDRRSSVPGPGRTRSNTGLHIKDRHHQ